MFFSSGNLGYPYIVTIPLPLIVYLYPVPFIEFHFVFIDSISSPCITKLAVFSFFFHIPQQETRDLISVLCCYFPSAECIVWHSHCQSAFLWTNAQVSQPEEWVIPGVVMSTLTWGIQCKVSSCLDCYRSGLSLCIACSHTMQHLRGTHKESKHLLPATSIAAVTFVQVSFVGLVLPSGDIRQKNHGKEIRTEPVSDN